jgi:hypothetical protein
MSAWVGRGSQLPAADSTGRRNALGKAFCRRFEAECFSGSLVQPSRDGVEPDLIDARQIHSFNVAGLFALAGVLGLLLWPILIPIAYFAHALWDFAHHVRLRLPLVAIPAWYVPWCVVIDVIVGAGLLVIWRAHGLI